MELSGLFELAKAQRFGELERILDEAEAEVGSDDWLALLRLKSELSAHGRVPVTDALLAARAFLQTDDPSAPELLARAVGQLGRIGARQMARDLMNQGLERWPEHDAIALAKRQVEVERFDGASWAQWEVLDLVARGDHSEARRHLEEMLEGDELLWAAQHLVDLQRGERDFEGAAATFDRVVEAVPEADDVLAIRLSVALTRWAAGLGAVAVEELRSLREETAEGHPLALWVNRTCKSVLESIDSQPDETGPAWSFAIKTTPHVVDRGDPGRDVVRLVGACLGHEVDIDESLPTMPHVRRALASWGVASARIVLDEQRLAVAFEEGALVVLEEERATDTGFLLLEGLEPTARLLLVRDPARLGPYIRDVDDQWERSALFGRSALLIGGVGDEGSARLERLEQRGLAHDVRLDAVDLCELDEEGRVPQQARIASLAEEAVERAPELPLPHKRLGEALLEQMRLGVISPFRPGPYEKWHAETRYRFPDAEWPRQIHAQALELQERLQEAGVAWGDAAACDPFDHRNFAGSARSRAALGDHEGADRDLRRALTLEPRSATALCQRAELALGHGDVDEAELLADLAMDIEPENPSALLVAATTREQRDAFDEAMTLLENAATLSERPTEATLRLLRRRLHDGDWEGARASAEHYCALAPGAPGSWSTATWVRWATGDYEGAMNAATTGLQRCGPDRDLIEMSAATAGMLLVPEAVGEALVPIIATLRAVPQAMLDLASELSRLRLWEVASEIGLEASALMPEGPNGTWRTAQILLGEERARVERADEIVDLLRATIERSGGYPFPRVVLGWLIADEDPEAALELVESSDEQVAPAMVWTLMEHLFDRLGRGADAERVRERIPELYPVGVLDSAMFLRTTGFIDVSRRLLEGAHAAAPEHPGVIVELALTLIASGAGDRALELLDSLRERDPRSVSLGLMSTAAIAARDWSVVERCAADAIAEGRRRSWKGFADPWSDRARLAGARLANGDEEPRARFLERAGRHPDGLVALHAIERHLEHPLAEETRKLIVDVAPGVLQIVERGGLR